MALLHMDGFDRYADIAAFNAYSGATYAPPATYEVTPGNETAILTTGSQFGSGCFKSIIASSGSWGDRPNNKAIQKYLMPGLIRLWQCFWLKYEGSSGATVQAPVAGFGSSFNIEASVRYQP